MTVVIVDYGSGNLRSAAKAFEKASAASKKEAQVLVSARADEIANAAGIQLDWLQYKLEYPKEL